MAVLDRVGFIRATYPSNYAGSSQDQTMGNVPSVFGSVGLGGYGQSASAQGSVQATGLLILALLAVLVFAHKKLPMGL